VTNKLFYGDNLEVLRGFSDESVDLIYLDPPFNSNAGYNVLFKAASGAGADASIEAFDDTWTWGDSAKEALLDIAKGTNRPLQVMMEAMRTAIGENPLMAYLAMMAVRLVELHRVLRPTGSLYLHCDPTASHYLKLVLDAVFGPENFRSEIAWKRTAAHSAAKRWGNVHDTLFFYSKSGEYVWNEVLLAHTEGYSDRYRNTDERGRVWADDNMTAPGVRHGFSGAEWRGLNPTTKGLHWKISNKAVEGIVGKEAAAKLNTIEKLEVLDADGLLHWPKQKGDEASFPRFKRVLSSGQVIQDVVTDIPPLNSQAQERLGYPTQKPRALLERIIAASSNAGDVVLDPFCGCGTAVDAAQKLGRQWIGIDVTHIAIGMIETRMRDGYPGIEFETIGVPKDLASAEKLAADDPHQFQQWVCWQVGGYPREKKGGDKGVDGWFNYLAEGGKIETGVISVKAGDIVNPNMVRDLGRVMERDKHRFGLFVMKSLPTKGMCAEADSQPTIETEFGRFPALQFVTLAELFQGLKPKLPPLISPVKKASRVEVRASHQKGAQGALL
jgi:site-specific DNA-methyltransferase (adenine-specific)